MQLLGYQADYFQLFWSLFVLLNMPPKTTVTTRRKNEVSDITLIKKLSLANPGKMKKWSATKENTVIERISMILLFFIGEI